MQVLLVLAGLVHPVALAERVQEDDVQRHLPAGALGRPTVDVGLDRGADLGLLEQLDVVVHCEKEAWGDGHGQPAVLGDCIERGREHKSPTHTVHAFHDDIVWRERVIVERGFEVEVEASLGLYPAYLLQEA